LTFLIAHDSLFGGHPENSLEACNAAIEDGMDGFCVCVQPTADGVCVVARDCDLAPGGGPLRKVKFSELPTLKSGGPVPKLSDALDIGAMIISIELIGEPGWKSALAAVEASGLIDRVVFSSLEHSEVLQLWAACPQAKCGFIWKEDEADSVTEQEISNLPGALLLFAPVASAHKRADFWGKYAERMVIWNTAGPGDVASLGFEPFLCIVG
jgi:glycerophosphoryl diester phosphodiesterase